MKEALSPLQWAGQPSHFSDGTKQNIIPLMLNQFSRTELVLGPKAMEKLSKARVAVFGIGGVGGNAVEALVRSGIGQIDIIDNDKFSITNINRQLFATMSSVGRDKVDVAVERIHDLNPECIVRAYKTFYLPETASEFNFEEYDYIVDAVDTVTAKLNLIVEANKAGVPIISAMGCGNKVDPSLLEITDIYKTSIDPLSRIMRQECKKRGIKHLKVVFSKEPPLKTIGSAPEEEKNPGRRDVPGSTAFVPTAAGLLIASQVVRDLVDFDPSNR